VQQFRDALQQYPNHPFRNQAEKRFADIILQSGLTNNWTDQLCDLLESVGCPAIGVKGSKDLKELLAQVPLDVQALVVMVTLTHFSLAVTIGLYTYGRDRCAHSRVNQEARGAP
jgi:hypothetical protein